MDELHTLIDTVEVQLSGLRAQAGKDVTAVADDLTAARQVVETELKSVVTKLEHL
jgi:hypothetical protein